MSQSHSQHTSLPPNGSRPNGYLSVEFKKAVPTLIITILVAFATSWYNTQASQTDAQRRIQILEKQAETNATNIAQNALAMQQNAIRVAEMVIIQNNTLEQIREIKSQQQLRK